MLTLIRCPFHLRVTAVARKRPRSFGQKCRWQVTPKHSYMLDPTKSEWADYAAVKHSVRSYQGNELTRNLSGNIRPQSSQLAEPLWTDPCIKIGIRVLVLISTLKKKGVGGVGEAPAGIDSTNFSPISLYKSSQHHHCTFSVSVLWSCGIRLCSTMRWILVARPGGHRSLRSAENSSALMALLSSASSCASCACGVATVSRLDKTSSASCASCSERG